LRLHPRRPILLLGGFQLAFDVLANLFLPFPQLADRLGTVSVGLHRLRGVSLDLADCPRGFNRLGTLTLCLILQVAFDPLVDCTTR